MKKAVIMDVQRFSIHDGPGIRTTVFLKGCHMKCQWCHNPESQNPEPEMLFYRERCIGCMACMDFCKRKAHMMEDGKHGFDPKHCTGCTEMQECSQNCPAEALCLCGKEMDAVQVLEKVLADRSFYGEEGGVTCSGGEALLQDEFLQEFLTLCKENNLSTCLDTTLNVAWERIERILKLTDLFLVDIKFMNPLTHMQYTQTKGELVIKNLRRLSEQKKPVILRMPLIAGFNNMQEEIEARRRLLKELSNVRRVDYFAVSNHGMAKYRALQRGFRAFNHNVDKKELVENMRKEMEDI